MLSLHTAVSVTFFLLFIATVLLFWLIFHKDFIPSWLITALNFTDNGVNVENPSSLSNRTMSTESYMDSTTLVKDELDSRCRSVSFVKGVGLKVHTSTTDKGANNEYIKSYTVSSTHLNNVVFVHVSQDTIRAYSVKCGNKSDVGATLEAGLDDSFSPKNISRGSSITSVGVPTVQMSHVEMRTVQEYNYLKNLLNYIIYAFLWLFDFILRWTPIGIAFCASVVIVTSWYVTLAQGDDTTALDLTNTMYAFTTFCLVGEALLFIQGYRRGNRTVMMSHGMLWAYVLFCWILALELVYLAGGGNPAQRQSSGHSKTSSYSGPDWAPFRCECDNKENRRLMANDYSWSCPTTNYADICDTDCGVCGAPYYGTFVTFAVCFALFWLCALFFGFFSYYYTEMRLSSRLLAHPDIHSHAHLVLHGSHCYGYPIHLQLTLEEGLALVKVFSRVHLEGDLGVKGPMHPIKEPSRPAPGINKAVSDSTDAVWEFFGVVFKVALEVFKMLH